MSHYSVAVLMDGEECPESHVDEMMEGYNEDWSGLDKSLLEFDDVEDSLMKKWKENTILESDKPEINGKAIQEAFKTFEQFVKYEEGFEERDETMGRFGYWSNPDAHWDWYVIGGRWENFLPIKKGRKGNICRIKDLDYKKIEEDAFKKANIFYDELIVARKIMDGIEQDPGMFMYNIFEKVEAMNIGIYDDDKKLIGLKDISRETIVKDNLHLFRWGTFAVVNEDGWNESGSMGWFGCSSYGDGQYMDWYKHYFDKFIMPREKDDFIAIVDCHI